MLETLEARAPLQIDGSQDYGANERFRLRFNDVTELEHGETFVSAIELAIDAVFEHDNGGAAVLIPELVIPRLLESVKLRIPGGHVFFDLPEQAGRALALWDWFSTGRYPEVTQVGRDATLSVPIGGTATARMKIRLPFVWPEGIEPDDVNVALRDLKNAQLECQWANADAGGIFDTGANNERVTAATTVREATIELVARDEYRKAPFFTLQQVTLSGIEENLALNDVRLHSLMELRLLADGITERYVTDAQRDRYRLRVGSKTVIDRVDARELVAGWNARYARGADDRLDQMEASTSDFVPIIYGRRVPRKMTHSPLVEAIQPRMRAEGDGTLTTPTLLMYSTQLNKLPEVVKQMRKSKVPVNEAFLSGAAGAASQLEAKTYAKTPIGPGAAGIQTMPIKHSPAGDKRMAA